MCGSRAKGAAVNGAARTAYELFIPEEVPTVMPIYRRRFLSRVILAGGLVAERNDENVRGGRAKKTR